jgi:branched-chain amino acid transport system substrate-binding protein
MKQLIFFLFAIACLCGCSKKAEQTEYITIGVLLPLTSESFYDGLYVLNGLYIAKAEINENGGILGKKLDLIALNDRGDEQYIVQQYNALKEKGVVAIIGSSFSHVTMALAKAAEKDGIPVISPTASNPAVTMGRRNVFRAIFTDVYQAEVMAKFARSSINAKTAVVMYNSNHDSHKNATEVFSELFTDQGGKVIGVEPYTSENDYEDIIKKYAAKPPDVIYCPNYYAPAAKLLNTVFKLGLRNTYLLGSDAWSGILDNVSDPKARERVFYTTSFSFNYKDSVTEKFVKDYFSTFSKMPLTGSANAYTCVYILSEAIKKAGNTNSDDIVSAMKENELNTIIGRIKFDENNNPHPNVHIVQIKGGVYATYKRLTYGE